MKKRRRFDPRQLWLPFSDFLEEAAEGRGGWFKEGGGVAAHDMPQGAPPISGVESLENASRLRCVAAPDIPQSAPPIRGVASLENAFNSRGVAALDIPQSAPPICGVASFQSQIHSHQNPRALADAHSPLCDSSSPPSKPVVGVACDSGLLLFRYKGVFPGLLRLWQLPRPPLPESLRRWGKRRPPALYHKESGGQSNQ